MGPELAYFSDRKVCGMLPMNDGGSTLLGSLL